MIEISLGSALNRQRPKLGEQTRRPVIARGITALDFHFNLGPNAGAPLPKRVQPGAAHL